MSDSSKDKSDRTIGANNALVVVIIILVAVLITIGIAFIDKAKQSSSHTYVPSSSSSTTTDWDAYCRDMFPDSPSARRGCLNGATATDNLMNGKYDR